MTVAYLFRNDLRLHDQVGLQNAIALARQSQQGLLHLVCRPDFEERTPWGFLRWSGLRQAWWHSAVRWLAREIEQAGGSLLVCAEPSHVSLPLLLSQLPISVLMCEDICAPEERQELALIGSLLRAHGGRIETHWQSSLLDPRDLPWSCADLPPVFTDFRKRLEAEGICPPQPLPTVRNFPPSPDLSALQGNLVLMDDEHVAALARNKVSLEVRQRSSFPFDPDAELRSDRVGNFFAWSGAERSALLHLERYFAAGLAHSYKRTRNGLTGTDYSSKWSPWLATGALSARLAFAALREFEAKHGANEGTYWLWFELLWRDYFRFLHLQYGDRLSQLYRYRGLQEQFVPGEQIRDVNASHNQALQAWCEGNTGVELIDAGMRELKTTGYLSNRLRQVVASYLIYDLELDWRAGAAWFEAQLLDYDVYSNQGNWLYIAGRGTDPRGGRRFNIEKQQREHDVDRSYRQMWLS